MLIASTSIYHYSECILDIIADPESWREASGEKYYTIKMSGNMTVYNIVCENISKFTYYTEAINKGNKWRETGITFQKVYNI